MDSNKAKDFDTLGVATHYWGSNVGMMTKGVI